MDIHIGNQLIADTLGFQDTNHGWQDVQGFLVDVEDKDTFKLKELKFHSDWNWLMVALDVVYKLRIKEEFLDNVNFEIKTALLLSDSTERRHKVWIAVLHAIQHKQ
jgi:hypothetical protein